MHILVNTYGYPTKKTKGNPFVKEMAEALAKKGNKVTIVLFVFTSPFSLLKDFFKVQFIDQWQKAAGVKLINAYSINFFPGNKFVSTQKKLILLFAVCRLRWYMLFNGKPDLIQHHYILNAQPWIIEYLSNKFNIPYVLFEHSPSLTKEHLDSIIKSKLHPFYTKNEVLNFVNNSKARVARTDRYKQLYKTALGSEFLAIPSFVSNRFTNSPIPAKTKEPFVFFALGDLTKRKSFDRLIRAFALKFRNDKDVLLQIAGEGPMKISLLKLIQELQLKDQVKLIGLLSKKEVFNQMDQSNVLVVASEAESFGNTLIEAMSRGVPVVSTKCGGPEEIINDTNGLLAERNDEDLAEKMWEMYRDYEKYNANEIVKKTKEKYGENSVINEIMTLYKAIL